jgi:hypothetical protein
MRLTAAASRFVPGPRRRPPRAASPRGERTGERCSIPIRVAPTRDPLRVVRDELARGRAHDPRRAQGGCHLGAAQLPAHARGGGLHRRRLRRGRGVCDAELAELFAKVRPHAPKVRTARSTAAPRRAEGMLDVDAARRRRLPTRPPAVDWAAASELTMIYTSGTTGARRARCARRSATPSRRKLLAFIGYRPDDVYLTTGPLYHSGPGGFMAIAHRSATRSCSSASSTPRTGCGSSSVPGHTTFSAPTPIRRLPAPRRRAKARYDRSSMRIMIANAAPWSFALKRRTSRLPGGLALRGVRLHRARRQHDAAPEDQRGSRAPAGSRRRGRDPRSSTRTGAWSTEPRTCRASSSCERRACSHLPQGPGEVRGGPARRLADGRRRRLLRRGGLLLHLRPQEGHDHLGRR